MKDLIIRMLAAIGLVPARRHAALARQVDNVRQESRTWEKQARKATSRVETLEQRVSDLESKLKEQIKLTREARASVRENSEFEAMQNRLVEAEQAAGAAREHLMAIEVKLEILEGAANVLDARTRATIQQARKTGAPV